MGTTFDNIAADESEDKALAEHIATILRDEIERAYARIKVELSGYEGISIFLEVDRGTEQALRSIRWAVPHLIGTPHEDG